MTRTNESRKGWRVGRAFLYASAVFALMGGSARAGQTGKKPKATASPRTSAAPVTPRATVAAAEPTWVSRALDRLQNRYATAQDVQADFTQDLLSTTLGKTTQKANGHVYFKKPGKMRWEYEAPEEQLTVSDGKTLWFYQPRIHQVLVSEVNEELLSKYTVSFLTGVGDVRKDFRVEPAEGKEPAKGEAIRLLLYPIEEAPFTKVWMEVSSETYLVQATIIYDHFGNENRIDFQGIKINTGVPDTRFQFELPPGVQVIRSPEPVAPAPAPEMPPQTEGE